MAGFDAGGFSHGFDVVAQPTTLSQADVDAIADAVLARLLTAQLPVNVWWVNDVRLQGRGVVDDPMRPA